MTASAPASDTPGYRPQLDGVRAAAILVVLISHFWPPEWPAPLVTSSGYYGVVLFFVLSGYLITGILWRDRAALRIGATTARRAFGQFYLRRTLRIFPTYYLTLLYCWIAGLGVITSSLPWFAAYLTNVYLVRHGLSGSSTHLWSLAVEEQFYLLWPAVILLLPRRLLFAVFAAAIAAGVLFRATTSLPHGEYLLPACIDYLAAGSALAIVASDAPPRLRAVTRTALAIAAVLAAISFAVAALPLRQAAFELGSCAFVGAAARGLRGPAGTLLAARPVRYIGKISYGIYLFHNFVAEAVFKCCRAYGLPKPAGVVSPVVMILLTLALAAASWHFIERPLRDLRSRIGAPR